MKKQLSNSVLHNIELALEEMENHCDFDNMYHGCNRVAVIFEDDYDTEFNTHCLGDLNHTNSGLDSTCVLSLVMEEYIEGDDFLQFCDWLINRSPWHDGFISNDAKQVYDNRYFLLDCEAPANVMIGGGIASRCLWEHPYIARAFCRLAECGVNENLAYLIANKASFNGDNLITFNNQMNGHHATYNNLTKAYIKAFVNNERHKVMDSYREVSCYHSINELWGNNWDTPKDPINYLQATLDEINYEGVDIYKNNPFHLSAKKIAEGTGEGHKFVKIRELKEAITPIVNKIMEDIS